jgi:hypothetical protein
MSKENDDFVENLLSGLPKAEPISEFELRKFEKMIDRQAAEYKASKKMSRYKFPASVAASIAIVFGAAFVLTNQNPALTPSTTVTKPGSNTESSNTNSTDNQVSPVPTQSNPSKSTQTGSAEGEVFGDSGSAGNKSKMVPIFNSNLDYATELNLINEIVVVAPAPKDISSLEDKFQQCAIKLGISRSILAFDKGYFQGERASAYFSGSDKSNYKIILVDSECTLLSEI